MSAPLVDKRTKIRQTQVSRTVSKQRRDAGAGPQSRRRTHDSWPVIQ